jgi:general secretion pathway protein G
MQFTFEGFQDLFKRRASLGNQKGFSLLEIIIVLAIIGTLVGIIVSRLTGGSDSAKLGITDTKAYTLQSKLIQYQLGHDNKFPTTAEGLQTLLTGSGGVAIATDDDLKDGWGNPFEYKLTSKGPLITSMGKEGSAGNGTTSVCYLNGKKQDKCDNIE